MLRRMALCVVTIVMSVQLYFWQLFDVCVCVCVCIIIHPSKLLVNVANFKNFVKFKKKKKVSVFYSTFHSSLKLSVIRYLYCHCTVIHSTRVLCSTMKLENRHINLSP